MPRGSRPGERRGGRQRGTPNKKTALRNAAIGATTADPGSLPLDFLLRLMRDPNLTLDLRVDLATTAAPFVHGKPKRLGQAGTRVGGPSSDVNGEGANSGTEIEGTDSGTEKGVRSGTEMQEANSGTGTAVDCGIAKEGVNPSPAKGEAALAGFGETAEASDGPRAPKPIVPVVEAPPIVPASKNAPDLSPLDFLLSVMKDPQAAPLLRIRAARVTAPYVHAKAGQAKADDEVAIEDPYGFTFDLDVAKALREDILALQNAPSDGADEKRAIEKRIFERQMTLPDPPASYKEEDNEWEWDRLRELEKIAKMKRRGSRDAKKIEAEAVILTARTMAYRARHDRPRFSRLSELIDKRNRVGTTHDEVAELLGLFSSFPHLELPPFIDAYTEAWRLAARSYRKDYDPAKPDPRPNPKSTEGDPYWAAARAYRKRDAEREAKKKSRR
jgi:hypothetical protein